MTSAPIVLVVAVALVDTDGRVLLQQRPAGKAMAGLWEFPGGKLGQGESPEAALIRELREELGIDTEESCLAPFTFASHRYDEFHLLMPLYVCRVWDGIPRACEGQTLKWAAPETLRQRVGCVAGLHDGILDLETRLFGDLLGVIDAA